jgi:transcriptional regulator with XRE-family HTH domain
LGDAIKKYLAMKKVDKIDKNVNVIMSFNEQLKKVLQNIGCTQTEFAEEIGTSRPRISKLISGAQEPNLAFLEAMYKVYKINLNWLVCSRGNVKVNEPGNISAEPEVNYGSSLEQENQYLKKLVSSYEEVIELQKQKIIKYEQDLESSTRKTV